MKRYQIYPETTSFYFCTSTINYKTTGAGHYNPVREESEFLIGNASGTDVPIWQPPGIDIPGDQYI
jgi:hypothetical protein